MSNDKELIPEILSSSVRNKDIPGLAARLRENKKSSEAEKEVEFDHTEQEDSGPKFPKFTEKKIRNMIKAPFELAFLFTGVPEVRITDDEMNLILEDTVDVMNELVKVNPLWLAGFGILVNGGGIVMHKIQVVRDARAKKADEKKQQS